MQFADFLPSIELTGLLQGDSFSNIPNMFRATLSSVDAAKYRGDFINGANTRFRPHMKLHTILKLIVLPL